MDQKSKMSKDHKVRLEIKGSNDRRSYRPNGISDISMTLVTFSHIFMHKKE